MAVSTKSDPNIKILRAIAGGARSLGDLKKVLRRDVRGAVNQLIKDISVEKVDGDLTLTKRGAGRLRFAD